MKKCLMNSLVAVTIFLLALTAKAADQPNIVMIVSDDLMKQIELYGDKTIKPPSLSKLAQES